MRIRLLALVAILVLPLAALAQKSAAITGTWEGDSMCTVRDSPCHDEHVIYEIARDTTAEDNPDRLGARLEWKIDAYKIVNGERQFMGSIPCSFDDKKQTLNCFTKTRTEGYWEFIFEGDSFQGTLRLGTEKTLFRKISARKVSKN